ncbi:sigma-70 family RNA polymerase sigma factor [Lysinibacter sp. HNR]|uniref:sigma-70 family RNA polymerase sigma factor n=1 Tax=Lysinibacter sp. HNR TaxID=3031408 RepID=UPI002435C675|nr:sigma-70 family RNA polymerase sigma factor [Lysinibacter sp. HNR]WGD37784.1 sigma-70 family RNA polymerase sigma factor [Lysinibacter sp. HNR]
MEEELTARRGEEIKDSGGDYLPSEDNTQEFHDDAELIRGWRRGEQAAAKALYQNHYGRGIRIAYRLVGERDVAEEVTSEAFTKVFEALNRGKGPTLSFGLYLATTIRSIISDRSRNRENPVDETTMATLIEGTGDQYHEDNSPGEVIDAFNSLSEKNQKIIWYRDVEQMPIREVAELLDIPPKNLSVMYQRARAQLRARYLEQLSRALVRPECREYAASYGDYAAGLLSKSKRKAVEEHLKTCDTCPAIVEEVSHVAQRFLAALPFAGAGALVAGRTLIATEETKLSGGLLHLGAGRSVPAIAGVTAAVVGVAVAAAVFFMPGQEVEQDAGAPREPSAAAEPVEEPQTQQEPGPTAESVVPVVSGAAGSGSCNVSYKTSAQENIFSAVNTSGSSCVVTYEWDGKVLHKTEVQGSQVFDAARVGLYSITVATDDGVWSESFQRR